MKNKPHRFLLYLLLRSVMALIRFLPRSFGLFLASIGGQVAFLILPHYRRAAIEHLKIAFPSEFSEAQLNTFARRTFTNLAKTAFDWAKWASLSEHEKQTLFVSDGGGEKFKKILSQGRGLVIVTAHLGNWELEGAFVARYIGVHAIGKRIYYEPFNRIITNLRTSWGVHTIYSDAPPREIIAPLKKGEMIALLPDQDLRNADGIFVPFFGKPAFTPTSPVRFAIAADAPLLPIFCVWEGSRYRVIVEEPVEMNPVGSRPETIRFYTERWMAIFEKTIRKYPDQWVWLHDRWKTQPPEQASSVFPEEKEHEVA